MLLDGDGTVYCAHRGLHVVMAVLDLWSTAYAYTDDKKKKLARSCHGEILSLAEAGCYLV